MRIIDAWQIDPSKVSYSGSPTNGMIIPDMHLHIYICTSSKWLYTTKYYCTHITKKMFFELLNPPIFLQQTNGVSRFRKGSRWCPAGLWSAEGFRLGRPEATESKHLKCGRCCHPGLDRAWHFSMRFTKMRWWIWTSHSITISESTSGWLYLHVGAWVWAPKCQRNPWSEEWFTDGFWDSLPSRND